MDYSKVEAIVKNAKKFVMDKELRDSIKKKSEFDFVTQVDLMISTYIKEELFKIAPEIGFMSEEEDCSELKSKRWILDPIDGTTNLVFDYQMSSISLALLDNGKIQYGIVYNPYNDDVFTSIRGEGAYLNGNRIHCEDRDLSSCLVEFGAGVTRKNESTEIFTIANEIFKTVLDLRRICSSALAIAYIAAGRMNGYFEKKIKPWDYAAASLILEEAGGKMCDWNGADIQFDVPGGIICGSPKVFKYLKSKII